MVPSDPKSSLFPDRHARSERGIQRWRGLCPLLPAAGFGRLRIEALVRARNSFSGRSTLFDAAFHSPAARAGLATRPRNRIDAPGLHLQSGPEALPDPFGSTLPPPFGLLLTSRGAFHA